MNHRLTGLGLGLTLLGTPLGIAATAPPSTAAPQSIAQAGSQAAQTRIVDLGVSQSQLQQMQGLGMRLVMPRTVPPGFQLTQVVGNDDGRFKSYLLVYRKGNSCFGIEGATGGIGSVPAGQKSHTVRNAVLGRGQIEQQSGSPALIGQWMGRAPFYRFVGAGYRFNGGSELAGCQDVTAKEAVFISEALRYIDLTAGTLEPTPVVDANSPTSTVVRYPSNEELTAFNRTLKAGGFSQIQPLTAAQRQQRQAYQAQWQKVNPTGARFVGAWNAGDRIIYVYPSKVKSRVCVVTFMNDKYEFANGQAISRELRYLDRGLFWVDQANVLAARNSGTGELFPVYATTDVPDPAGLTNFDFGFKNADCTTTLPGQ